MKEIESLTKGKYSLIDKTTWSALCFAGKHSNLKLGCQKTKGKAKFCTCPCHLKGSVKT